MIGGGEASVVIGEGEASSCCLLYSFYFFFFMLKYSILNFSLIFSICLPYCFVAFFKYF